MNRERIAVGLLLAAIFAIRAIHPGQPIVENYVGRQIPTAMVARNLERGSGFLRPQLDTGPFPNLFLVEPPIYEVCVVAMRPLIGFDLEPTGRLVSAMAIALAGWGLYGLVRRREGVTVALLTLGSFGIFPVMIRFGRAFQPDALMIGCVLAGLRCWDEYEVCGKWRWALFGGFVLGIGLALKITVIWTLIPFALIVRRWSMARRIAAAGLMIVPAGLWYLHAWGGVRPTGSGSLASFDNASVWLQTLSPSHWLRFGTLAVIGDRLAIRSFTPIGFVLAIGGLVATGKLDPLWRGWAIGCGLAIVGLAAKWHHAYYWMVVAPLVAVGMARGLVKLGQWGRSGRGIALLLGSFFLAMCGYQSASTWRIPPEWGGIVEAGRLVSSHVLDSSTRFLVAPEALLYYADRKGCRLEFDPIAIRRAAGEWDERGNLPERPEDLVEFYRNRSVEAFEYPGWETGTVRHVADVGPASSLPRRKAFREAIRSSPNYHVLVDQSDLMIAEIR